MSERILVIRLGALGDLVLCFEAFQAIRNAHPKAEIALLTMPAFAGFARQMPWFDRVLTDPRAPRWRLDAWGRLVRDVRAFAPTRVYDLQGKSRQTMLFYLLGGPFFGPEWSGAAPGCSHPRLWPPKPGMHFTDFIAAQLERAGIGLKHPPLEGGPKSHSDFGEGSEETPSPAKTEDLLAQARVFASSPSRGEGQLFQIVDTLNLSWLDAPLDAFELPAKYALLIPGCAPGREYKRWPPEKYAALAGHLREKGIASVAIGTAADQAAISEITALAPHVMNLCGETSLAQVAALARGAEIVIGNDTGPTHLAAAVGARTLALMSDKVDPLWSAPKGPNATWLQGKPLEAVSAGEVLNELGLSTLRTGDSQLG
ncbi:MAG: glycosyltransferase family 9 protein [Alphaproteobacteria bacterium]|nr:glycosyltransferase family 9 protein [Alphaproteobacteria bacterium]